ncbi:hypothetical protein L6164_005206 [Bauhinia variegata]|uniref:Uncharacterized protein n=1 Tax=Bauhinia variegata TaxID=167791 RepID=A0ACB9PR30_BAUVA|nr:hypothetical protein L6164_005206 [Bauhinia variegata]
MEDRSVTGTAESEAKRRKTDEPPSRWTSASSDAKTRQASNISKLVAGKAPLGQIGGINSSIEQAKNFSVAQARHDGSTGNYRIFDSPYGNFLLPVVPTCAELAE